MMVISKMTWMGWCKKDVTPLLMDWSYIFLALTQQHNVSLIEINPYGSDTTIF